MRRSLSLSHVKKNVPEPPPTPIVIPKGKMRYDTLDNGGYPFIVDIDVDKSRIVISTQENVHIFHFPTDQIFIGTSPQNAMTEFSGGYGSQEDGNSILGRLMVEKDLKSKNIYYFIGHQIYRFLAKARIIYYTSPVGNNSVPYPWAQDEAGNIYLMTEKVILTPTTKLNAIPRDKNFDPYTYYYTEAVITLHNSETNQTCDFRHSCDPDEMFDRFMQDVVPDSAPKYDWIKPEHKKKVVKAIKGMKGIECMYPLVVNKGL